MYPILFQLGGLELRSYGVIVAFSVFIALWVSTREAGRKGIDRALIQDFVPYALFAGIIGARIYFILFSEPSYFYRNPWEILAFWHGGIGVIGSILGGFLAAVWYCRKKHISFWRFADILALGIPLGQTVGQFACLLNGDSWGKPTNLPWAITYTDPRSLAPLDIPLHPIEIYEMVAYFLVFLIVWRTREKWRTDGFTFFTYLAGYGAARFSVEVFRGQPAIFTRGIPAAQVFGVALILVSVVGFGMFRKRPEAVS